MCLTSQLPATAFLLLGALPGLRGRCSGAAVQRPRLSVCRSGETSQDERTQSRAGGPGLRFWKKNARRGTSILPSTRRPSTSQRRRLDCLSTPHAPNLVFDCFFIPPPHRSRHRPSATTTSATHAWSFGWAAHRFIACAAAPPL